MAFAFRSGCYNLEQRGGGGVLVGGGGGGNTRGRVCREFPQKHNGVVHYVEWKLMIVIVGVKCKSDLINFTFRQSQKKPHYIQSGCKWYQHPVA